MSAIEIILAVVVGIIALGVVVAVVRDARQQRRQSITRPRSGPPRRPPQPTRPGSGGDDHRVS